MQYKSIVLELLQEQYPKLYNSLLQQRTLLISLDDYANELKTAHLNWMEELHRASPGSDPSQIKAEALELAIEHMQGVLPSESPPDEADALSLENAIAFVRRSRASA